MKKEPYYLNSGALPTPDILDCQSPRRLGRERKHAQNPLTQNNKLAALIQLPHRKVVPKDAWGVSFFNMSAKMHKGKHTWSIKPDHPPQARSPSRLQSHGPLRRPQSGVLADPKAHHRVKRQSQEPRYMSCCCAEQLRHIDVR